MAIEGVRVSVRPIEKIGEDRQQQKAGYDDGRYRQELRECPSNRLAAMPSQPVTS